MNPSAIGRPTAPVRGSTGVSPFASATHSFPAATAASAGALPTRTVCTTRSVPGSTRDSVPSRWLTTHSDPPAATIATGACPTAIVCTTTRLAGSTRATDCASTFATHNEPPAATTRPGGERNATPATTRPSLTSASALSPIGFEASPRAESATTAVASAETPASTTHRPTRRGVCLVRRRGTGSAGS